ncbi:MAG: SDR family NAD(P)-dependent oxidoreductase, partial [Pseudomonadales bacterium]
CQAAVATTIDHFGQLNLLVNNAGVVDSGPIEKFSEAAWDRIFAVNTKGIFLMTQAAVEALARAENASIVNTASIAGKKGVRHMAAYCGSKFAAIGVTQSLAQELAPKGIRVNAICPGIVGTAMWLEHLMPKAQSASNEVPEFSNYVSQLIPMGEPQTAEDMANAVVYLAQASNVTGIALTVAGGMEMN